MLVRLVFFIYLLAIFEGALRKWVAPQLSQYIFFIRDPFVIWAYFIAFNHRLWPHRSIPLRIGWVVAGIGALIAFLQIALSGFDQFTILLAGYGWRNYFLYLPLAFLVGEQFSRRDVMRLCRLTLWIALPVAFLIALQFAAAPDAPINVGNATNAAAQFRGLGLDGDHTRPMGTFTSAAGQTMFVSSAFAFVLALLILPGKKRPIGLATVLVGAIAVLSAVALGGSRYAFIHCGLSVAGAMLLGLFIKGMATKGRALLIPLGLALSAAIMYPVVFPEGFSAIAGRWNNAAEVETAQFGHSAVVGRALYDMVNFIDLLHVAPALGYGLGYGGNASTSLGATIEGATPLELAESDWARHIVDLGPVFGCAFIVCRIAFVLWLGKRVFLASRRRSDPVPALLFTFIASELFYGQVTGHGTINIYIWLYTGLCLASMRMPSLTRARAVRLPQRTEVIETAV
jgi:hypothetical protein